MIVGPVPAEAGNVVDMTDMTAASELNESTDPAGSHDVSPDVSPDVSREVQPVAGSANDPLAELESDLAAVDAALASLDRIELGGRTGESVVAEINAVVDPERFDRPAPGGVQAPSSELVGNGLANEEMDSGPEGPSS